MEYLKSLLANREAVTADTVIIYDLPVNPVSHINIDIEAALSAAYTPGTLANVGAIFDKVDVLFKGTSIVSLSGLDLMAYGAMRTRNFSPFLNRNVAVAAEEVFRFIIPFGRKLYNPLECFPAVRRGEFQLRLDYASSFTNITSLDATITTVELMGANPERFLKATTLSKTPVVGDNDIDLPLGNKICELLVFGTTVPTTTAKTASVDKLKLLVDNVEKFLHDVHWPELAYEFLKKLGANDTMWDHLHRENLAGAYTQNANTDKEAMSEELLRQYGMVDFDPLGDGQYYLETESAGRVWARVNAGDTNPIRIIPVEVIEVKAAAT